MAILSKTLDSLAWVPLLLLGIEGSALACDDYLKNYHPDCEMQDKYRAVKEKYDKKSISMDDITEYKALRFISENDYKPHHTETLPDHDARQVYQPWKLYNPNPKTWVYWEKGNYFRGNLSGLLKAREKEGEVWQVSYDDLARLHRSVIDKELLGKGQQIWFKIPGFELFFPPPGEIRSGSQITSGFSGEFTEAQKNAIENFDLIGSDGKPYVTGEFEKIADGKYKGSVKYTRSADVKREFEAYLKELNEGVNHFLTGKEVTYSFNGKTIKNSPIDFVSRMQRKYVAIHPFHEANGRMSRLIQDLILDRLGLPFIPSGQLQDDVVTPNDEYQKHTKARMFEILAKLEDCERRLERYGKKRDSLPGFCDPLYQPLKIEDDSRISEKDQALQDALERYQIHEEINRAIAVAENSLDSDVPCPSGNLLKQQAGVVNPLIASAQSIGGVQTDAQKRAKIESMATPLVEDLQSYSWVPSATIAFSRKHFYTNSVVFRQILGETSEISHEKKIMYGKGFYTSKSFLDSGQFALADKHLTELNAMLKTDKKGEAPSFAEKHSQNGILLKVVVKKGQKILNISDPAVVKELHDKTGLTPEEAAGLNPNIVLYYPRPNKDWMNIKLTDSNAFSVSEARPQDFSLAEAVNIARSLKNGTILGGHAFLRKVVDYHKEEWAKALKSDDKAVKSPFGDCVKAVLEKKKMVIVPANGECD